MIWSKYAGDPRQGYIYYDSLTKIEYPESSLHLLSKEIQARICQRYKVIGCYVKEMRDFK